QRRAAVRDALLTSRTAGVVWRAQSLALKNACEDPGKRAQLSAKIDPQLEQLGHIQIEHGGQAALQHSLRECLTTNLNPRHALRGNQRVNQAEQDPTAIIQETIRKIIAAHAVFKQDLMVASEELHFLRPSIGGRQALAQEVGDVENAAPA